MKLDLIFSIGPACRPAYHLRQHFLRAFSCPLDYQMRYSLNTVLHLFETSFSDFFSEITEDPIEKGAHNNRRVIDTKNSIISLHHFDRDIPLAAAQKQFQATMVKRFHILHDAILHAKTVGLICNRSDSLEELTAFLKSFGALYPDQHFILINIRNDESAASIQKTEHHLNHCLTIFEYTGCDQHPKDNDYERLYWIGNPALWNKVLKNDTLTCHPLASQIRQWMDCDRKILLYGAGMYCQKFLDFLTRYQLEPYCIAVTDITANPASVHSTQVRPVSAYQKLAHQCVVIITVIDPAISAEIKNHLKELGFDLIAAINDSFRLLS